MEYELKVTLLGGRGFIVELAGGHDEGTQARRILGEGAMELLEGEEFTVHPAHQILSVTAQAKEKGVGGFGVGTYES